jgi:hypothetical protein
MQQFLPLALRGLLAPRLQKVVMRVSKVFRRICNKVWNSSEIDSF